MVERETKENFSNDACSSASKQLTEAILCMEMQNSKRYRYQIKSRY